jgi:hypothetical protein
MIKPGLLNILPYFMDEAVQLLISNDIFIQLCKTDHNSSKIQNRTQFRLAMTEKNVEHLRRLSGIIFLLS